MKTTTKTRRASRVTAGALLLAGTFLATPVVAQRPDSQTACEMVPSLGITGIECQNCSFSRSNRQRSASFRTEPRILAVAPGGPSDGLLRPGDVLVAVDGQLITTARGGEAFSSYETGDDVRLTIRRDGREREVIIEAEEACLPEPPAPPAPPARPSPLEPVPPTRAPRAPAPPEREPATPRPPRAPTPPEPISELAGRVLASQTFPAMGLALACDDCWLQLEGNGSPTWRFTTPPVIRSVADGSAGQRAGLRAGDRIVRIDDLDIVSDRAGVLLGRLEPGTVIVLAVERGGITRDGRTIEARLTMPALPRVPAAQAAPRAPSPGPVRQVATLGDVEIEVRGESAVFIQEGDLIVIRSEGLEVRLRRRAPTPAPRAGGAR